MLQCRSWASCNPKINTQKISKNKTKLIYLSYYNLQNSCYGVGHLMLSDKIYIKYQREKYNPWKLRSHKTWHIFWILFCHEFSLCKYYSIPCNFTSALSNPLFRSWNSVLGTTMTRLQLENQESWVNSEHKQKVFLVSTAPRSAVGPIQPPIQWLYGVKWLRHGDDHSTLSSAEVTTTCSYTSTPYTIMEHTGKLYHCSVNVPDSSGFSV